MAGILRLSFRPFPSWRSVIDSVILVAVQGSTSELTVSLAGQHLQEDGQAQNYSSILSPGSVERCLQMT